MIQEGKGRIAPRPILVTIPMDELRLIYAEAIKREEKRRYTSRPDAWGNGMLRGQVAEMFGGEIRQAVMPILIGLVGEWATACHINGCLGTNIGIDLIEKPRGDGGTDILQFGLTIQIKARKQDIGGRYLVRYRSDKGYEYPPNADVYVFGQWDLSTVAKLYGCVGNAELRNWKKVREPQGHWNYEGEAEDLLPMSRLITELDSRRELGRCAMPLIRYPGSKAKLVNQIYDTFPTRLSGGLFADGGTEYREPFFGSGAIGFKVLSNITRKRQTPVWLNDKDPWMAALWRSVMSEPDALRKRIASFTPTAEALFEFKAIDGDTSLPDVDCGFMKLATHQMSVSGFGVMSGGPLGGKDQANANYPVTCRWNPQTLKGHVIRCHKLLSKFGNIKITSLDFADVLIGTPEDGFVYMDPPYVEKGEQLYKHNMDHAAHERLASVVQGLQCDWSLSYDDHPLVRRLYSWATIREIEVTYTNATHAKGARPKNREVVISRN